MSRKWADGPFGNIEQSAASFSVKPFRTVLERTVQVKKSQLEKGAATHRDPEIRLRLPEVNVQFLTQRMRSIDNTQRTLFPTYGDHFLPRHWHGRRGDNGVEYGHNSSRVFLLE